MDAGGGQSGYISISQVRNLADASVYNTVDENAATCCSRSVWKYVY